MPMTAVVKQDSVFFSVVVKRKQEKKKLQISPYARVAYDSVSGAFVHFMRMKMTVVLVWKFVL